MIQSPRTFAGRAETLVIGSGVAVVARGPNCAARTTRLLTPFARARFCLAFTQRKAREAHTPLPPRVLRLGKDVRGFPAVGEKRCSFRSLRVSVACPGLRRPAKCSTFVCRAATTFVDVNAATLRGEVRRVSRWSSTAFLYHLLFLSTGFDVYKSLALYSSFVAV